MQFEDNTMLFGFDPTPRIVAIELGETGTVRVYRREKNGATACDVEKFHPFVWTDAVPSASPLPLGEGTRQGPRQRRVRYSLYPRANPRIRSTASGGRGPRSP